jgi:hypothetical protein
MSGGNKRDDIQLFKTAGVDRGTNDNLNKRREDILSILYNPPFEFLSDPYWLEMSTKWREFLRTIYSGQYDDVKIKKMGGRKYNYDIEITFLLEGNPVFLIKAEFKHNAKTINELPEYFSPAANKPYFDVNYGDFFYENYIDRICSLSETAKTLKPTKAQYIKVLYQNEYKKNPFFSCLYGEEANKEFFKGKQELVRASIKEYLTRYLPTLKFDVLSKDIRDRQNGKVFIMWDLKQFRWDTIRENEMNIVSATEIKNDNTIVAVSEGGTEHRMLLRWKNHLGVLYPAWQISLRRSKSVSTLLALS